MNITIEYDAELVQIHTVIHEKGHGAGIADHSVDPACVMYEDSINWDRAGNFGNYARSQLLIHNF